MPNFNIIKKTSPKKTFRVQQLISQYDLNSENHTENFIGNIELDFDWQIGIIYGNSGTGKSTIAKELFNKDLFTGYQYVNESILDDMPKDKTTKEIFKVFNSVGFSSPPSWLKPYNVLSNGEKMRVDLARCILEENDLIVFDEFTSVVDRNVAKIGSNAISRAIKKTNKKFIAVSCHDDIINWLEPDWVFCTNNMSFSRGLLRRPKIKLEIYKTNREMWRIFRKYHYLNHEINKAAQCYVAYIENKPVAFSSVIHFPHGTEKRFKRGHRTVVLPDYQGVGIGNILSIFVAKLYLKMGFRFISVTSNPAFIEARKKNKNWKLKRFGQIKSSKIGSLDEQSANRMTTSWEYIEKL